MNYTEALRLAVPSLALGVTFLAITVHSASALIGEKVEKLTQRYGEPYNAEEFRAHRLYWFHASGFDLLADTYMEHRNRREDEVWAQTYFSSRSLVKGQPPPAIVQGVKAGEAPGVKWRVVEADSDEKEAFCSDVTDGNYYRLAIFMPHNQSRIPRGTTFIINVNRFPYPESGLSGKGLPLRKSDLAEAKTSQLPSEPAGPAMDGKAAASPSPTNGSAGEPQIGDVVANSPWDNSVRQVVNYLKHTLRDPDSYQSIEWSAVLKEPEGHGVRHKYRAKNGFGGYVINNEIFIMDVHGNVIRQTPYISPEDAKRILDR